MAFASYAQLSGSDVSIWSSIAYIYTEYPSTMLQQALNIYNNDPLYNNEIARTKYKLGCTLQDSGEISKGRIEIEKAETLRRQILGGAPDQDVDEESFDKLVMFWSR